MSEEIKGWKLVPIEPTYEMCEAAFAEEISLSDAHTNHGVQEHVYAAMLKSAPQICQNCMGEGIDGEPGDGLYPDALWACKTCDGTGRVQALVAAEAMAEELHEKMSKILLHLIKTLSPHGDTSEIESALLIHSAAKDNLTALAAHDAKRDKEVRAKALELAIDELRLLRVCKHDTRLSMPGDKYYLEAISAISKLRAEG